MGKPGRPRSDVCIVCKERPKAWKTSSYCRECANARRRDADRSDKTRVQAKNKAARERMKTAAYAVLGGKCVCCQESESTFLTLDHVNNDGADERRRGVNIWTIYKRILSGEWLDRFQLMCWNCNRGKWAYGMCPHIIRAEGKEPVIIAERHHRKNAPDLVVS